MGIVARIYDKLGRDNVFFMAAGLAFNVVTTLIPLLVLLFAGIGYALASSDTAMREVVGAIHRFLPFASDDIIGSLLAVVQSRGTIGVIGGLGLLWVATGVVSSIRTVLSTVFEVPETRSILTGKLFDIVMVFVLGTFFVLSVGFTTLFAIVQEYGVDILGTIGIRTDWVAPAAALGVALLVNVLMFTLIYVTAPARPVPILPALAGGVVTAVLFELAKQGFSIYITLARQGTLGPASGSLGAIILLLIWIYYSALVFILGAEAAFAAQARAHRSAGQESARQDRVEPARDAEKLARG